VNNTQEGFWKNFGVLRLSLRRLTVVMLALGIVLYGVAWLTAKYDAQINADRTVDQLRAVMPKDDLHLSPKIAEKLRDTFDHVSADLTPQQFAYDLAAHASSALIVAALLLWLVESRVRDINHEEIQSYKSEIAKSVWNAVSGHIIEREFVDQIENLFKYTTIRRSLYYRFEIEPPPKSVVDTESKGGELLLIRRTTRYRIDNISNMEEVQVEPQHRFDQPIVACADGTVFPYFKNFKIDGDDRLLAKNANEVHEKLTIVKGLSKEVVVVSEELYGYEALEYYIQSSPAIGLTVEVVNRMGDRVGIVGVGMTATAKFVGGSLATKSKPNSDGTVTEGVWEYAGACLPGQGFYLQWRRRGAAATAG
jgi:hypothetical protein